MTFLNNCHIVFKVVSFYIGNLLYEIEGPGLICFIDPLIKGIFLWMMS